MRKKIMIDDGCLGCLFLTFVMLVILFGLLYEAAKFMAWVRLALG